MRDYLRKDQPLRFAFPIDGDCINCNDGPVADGGILITAQVEAPEGHEVEIESVRAVYSDGCYRASVKITDKETVLTATDRTAGTACSVKVFRLKNPVGGYRLSSDDNIIFLADINDHKDEYNSIFDNPYLAVYKKAHDLYGAKVHLNLFYEFDDQSRSYFSKKREYFNLSMMTDKFKDEFIANSDWLKFSFHATGEFPNKPYRDADRQTVRREGERVLKEIVRFAGKEVLSGCTTVHWGEANVEAAKELRDMGYKAMTGYFVDHPVAPVAYYAPYDLIRYVYNRDFWKDTETDILFGRIDIVVNCKTHEENMQEIRSILDSKTRGGFLSLMIHEQYFYEDYRLYLPDFEQRVLEGCKLAAEAGRVGRWICDVDDIGPLYE